MNADEREYARQRDTRLAQERALAGDCPRCGAVLAVDLHHDGEVDGQHYFDAERVCPRCRWSDWYGESNQPVPWP